MQELLYLSWCLLLLLMSRWGQFLQFWNFFQFQTAQKISRLEKQKRVWEHFFETWHSRIVRKLKISRAFIEKKLQTFLISEKYISGSQHFTQYRQLRVRGAVWSHVGIKIGPMLFKIYPKPDFTSKLMFLKMAQTVRKYLGYFVRKFVANTFWKIAQSGHT